MNNLLDILKKHHISSEILKGNFGLEKENVRVTAQGTLATTPHPTKFGDKESNPYITVDFSESQIEMITPTLPSIDQAYDFLENIHSSIVTNLENEYLWNQSAPPILPDDPAMIPIAKFEHNKAAELYRLSLAKKYGSKKQLLSGIHFNFSFDDTILQKIFSYDNQGYSNFQDFKDSLYIKIARNYLQVGWIIVYLLGASPVVHKSYDTCCINTLDMFDDETYYMKNGISFRNSSTGYKNLEELIVNFDSLQNYITSIENLISKGILQNAREYYSPIRLKSSSHDIITGLKSSGIQYLEVRSIDLNPLNDIGIEKFDLQFIHLFLVYLLLIDDKKLCCSFGMYSPNHQELIATYGRNSEFQFLCCPDHTIESQKFTHTLLDHMEQMFLDLGITPDYLKCIQYQQQKLELNNFYTERLIKIFREKGFVNYHLEQAQASKDRFLRSSFSLKGYEDLELSTQIILRECILRGIKFEILDRKENFIRLIKNSNIQYIKQATKTSLDSYSTVLLMENKLITKKLLNENSISVPKGEVFYDKETALRYYHNSPSNIVIKPKSANFGLGITIFKNTYSQEEFTQAIELAFREDNTILIEEFIHGKEYRFLVIGDTIAGVLYREPANIIGDGISSIQELVYQKNKDPLRGVGYKTPLERLSIGESELLFLQQQNLTPSTIIEQGKKIYLRENSNISTGGDSIDVTDTIPESYKQIALQSAKIVDATICGVDMIIQNINDDPTPTNHAIIELNFNPAIHIHCYPFIGKNRSIGEKILDVLGY